jgi:hypothetical protein
MTTQQPKRIILVAGVEYPRYKKKPETVRGRRGKWWVLAGRGTTPIRGPRGSHWRVRCTNVAETALRADSTARVYLYDFDRGVEEQVKLVRGRLEFDRVQRNFPPLVDQDYRRVEGDLLHPITSTPLPASNSRPAIRYFPLVSQLGSGTVSKQAWLDRFGSTQWDKVGVSIRHVYQHIEYLGAHHPYTLQQFHLFGHASSSHSPRSGTALVNTDDWGRGAARHPLDLDPRADLDLVPPTIDPTKFRMAFATGAMSYVWGCNWHRPLFDVIRQAARALRGKKLQDGTVLRFTWRGNDVSGPLEQFKSILGASQSGWNDPGNTAERNGAFIRRLVMSLIARTYMQQLADASARCCTGGLPGTYSDYDVRREGRELRLSHIPMGRYGTQDVFSSVLRFYVSSLGVPLNRAGAHREFGRGFGLYCPRL